MPLRDLFRPPLRKKHRWDAIHASWPVKMVDHLFPQLPPEFIALPALHVSGLEVDIGTYESFDSEATNEAAPKVPLGSWTAQEPTLNATTTALDVDEYTVRIYDETYDRQLVATIELISPSNKDRPESRQPFIAKCVALLQQSVSVTIVDVVTVPESNLYAELLEWYGLTDASVAVPPTPIYAVTCRGVIPRTRFHLKAWHRPLAIGQPLPTLPVWLRDDLVVSLDLEATYHQAILPYRIP